MPKGPVDHYIHEIGQTPPSRYYIIYTNIEHYAKGKKNSNTLIINLLFGIFFLNCKMLLELFLEITTKQTKVIGIKTVP